MDRVSESVERIEALHAFPKEVLAILEDDDLILHVKEELGKE